MTRSDVVEQALANVVHWYVPGRGMACGALLVPRGKFRYRSTNPYTPTEVALVSCPVCQKWITENPL